MALLLAYFLVSIKKGIVLLVNTIPLILYKEKIATLLADL